MSAPVVTDGKLAWAISEWVDQQADTPIERARITSLANHLSAQGFGQPEEGGELSLADLRKLATKAKTSLTEFIKETGAPTAS